MLRRCQVTTHSLIHETAIKLRQARFAEGRQGKKGEKTNLKLQTAPKQEASEDTRKEGASEVCRVIQLLLLALIRLMACTNVIQK